MLSDLGAGRATIYGYAGHAEMSLCFYRIPITVALGLLVTLQKGRVLNSYAAKHGLVVSER